MFLLEEFVHYLYTVGCISENLKLFVQEVETLPAQLRIKFVEEQSLLLQ